MNSSPKVVTKVVKKQAGVVRVFLLEENTLVESLKPQLVQERKKKKVAMKQSRNS